MAPRTITSEQNLAAFLISKGVVVVPIPEEAQRMLDDHRARAASGLADMAQRLYARRIEYGIGQFLNDLSSVMGTQLSLIREALVCIFRVAADEEAVLYTDGQPEEVLFGDEDQLAAVLAR